MILGGFYNLKDRNCYIYISVIYLIAKIFFYNKIKKKIHLKVLLEGGKRLIKTF